ncbi:MAG: TolC family protein [Planctomycetaceae bacterium]|nr:TolC family protein [Planctomycetaceae bacterium]
MDRFVLLLIISVFLAGCRSSGQMASSPRTQDDAPIAVAGSPTATLDAAVDETVPTSDEPDDGSDVILTVSATQSTNTESAASTVPPTAVAGSGPNSPTDPPAAVRDNAAGALTAIVTLDTVIESVHQSYPLVEAAYLERQIANGNQLSTWGEFDTKIKASSENQPLGYYQTYRNSAGVYKPLYGGGEVFGAYRVGDGSFEPWYKERETDEAGEFKAGVQVPLIRNRDIDARRAALWRATYDQQLADPVIQASLIQFSHDAGMAYWKWVASGQKVRLGQLWLDIAADRNDAIQRRVQLGDLDPPELVDNQRAIAKREAKLADATREFRQAAVKLSLYFRDANGVPVVLSLDDLPDFPPLRQVTEEQMSVDINQALSSRPELLALDLQYRQLQVDLSEACNQTLPALDARLTAAQDVGQPASKKADKSEFEMEAAMFFDVPIERRKGRGKMHAVQSKMAQINAKRRITQDKISAEVQAAYAGMIQSRQEALKARQAVRLASEMAEIERRKFTLGDSDLLKVALREQYALEAAEEEITATWNHFVAFTDYMATLAMVRPTESLLGQ